MTTLTRITHTYTIKDMHGLVITSVTTSETHIKSVTKQLTRELGQRVRACKCLS